MFRALASPAATLTLEAPVDAHFDIFFNRSAAGAHGRQFASQRATQGGRNGVPVVDPVAVAQDITKEGVKFKRSLRAVDAGAQRLQDRFAVALPYRLHNAALLDLILAHERAHVLRDMPAVEQPLTLSKFSFPHPFKSFVAIAEEHLGGAFLKMAQPLPSQAPAKDGERPSA